MLYSRGMDAGLFLDWTGFSVSWIMFTAVIFSAFRHPGRRPFLSLLFLEGGIFFLGEILSGTGRFAGPAFVLSMGCNFLSLPSLYLFTRETLGTCPGRVAVHYLPALAAATGGTALALDAVFHNFHGRPALAVYMIAVPAIQTAQLVYYGQKSLRLAGPASKDRPNWPRRVTLACILGYGTLVVLTWLVIASLILGDLRGRSAYPMPGVDFSSSVVAVFFIWTLGLASLWSMDAVSSSAVKYGGRPLSGEDTGKILRRLRALLAAEEDLGSPEVMPRQLAERIREPYYLVSRAVNEGEGKTVADLVNEYRILRAKELLSGRPEATILEIAMDSGFQVKSTFNEVFKRTTGMTPGEFRRSSIKETS